MTNVLHGINQRDHQYEQSDRHHRSQGAIEHCVSFHCFRPGPRSNR
jgi:hypothetical protein